MVSIAKYTIDCSYRFDRSSMLQVDRAMKELEKKLKKFSSKTLKSIFSIDKFNVDQKKLNFTLGNALDKASNTLVFEISRFSVNDRNLRTALMRSQRGVGGLVGQQGMVGTRPGRESLPSRRGRSGTGGRDLLFAGGAAGAVARVGLAGLPIIGGALGLGALNRKNQEVVAAQLQTQAVVQQAGGTAEQGQQSFQFLRGEANRIGFNYLDASGDYNKLIAGLTGSGVGLQESQKVFSGFAELARVNKLDKTTQNRLFRALSQVAGKGKLMSEELTGQIAEALPGGTALFAQAYQRQTGGNLTGQASIRQLFDDMKKGKVSSDILTFAGAQASAQANKGGALTAASRASQAEQGRYQSTLNDLAVVASGAGVEEGFARIFRTLNAGLMESDGLIRSLARGFNEATKWADDLLLFPQSFVRALEGRDSLVADWLGQDATAQLREDWKSIKESFEAIMATTAPSWMPTLESTTKELAALLNAIAGLTKSPDKAIELQNVETIDPFGTGGYKSPVGVLGAAYNNALLAAQKSKERGQAVYGDPQSPFYNDPKGYDQMQKDQALAAGEERVRESVVNSFDISIVVDPVTLSNMNVAEQAQALADQFKMELETTMLQFPVKE